MLRVVGYSNNNTSGDKDAIRIKLIGIKLKNKTLNNFKVLL